MQWSEFSFIIKPSELGGVGVFSTHDITEGIVVFHHSFEPRILKKKNVPSDFHSYCIHVNEEEMIGPERFDRMEIGWFINHSEEPNIAKNNLISEVPSSKSILAGMKLRTMVSIKDIKAGDEILMDYNSFNEPEPLKSVYYK